MEFTVQIKDVTKSFITEKRKLFKKTIKTEFKAVDGISLKICKGEIFGLLGPNGAGKTTLIKMITGLLSPTSGHISVMDRDIDTDPVETLRNIGTVLAGDRSIYWKLTARENLEYFAALYGMSSKQARKRAQEVLQKLGLEEKADELVEKFSTGMKQKVALGKALIPNAQVVMLDEPTLGLDPQSALNLRETILDIKREGRTVLLTTHYMEEADFLCDRVAIIDGGKIIALDTPEKLKGSLNETGAIHIEISGIGSQLIDDLKRVGLIKEVLSSYDEERRTYNLILHHEKGEKLIEEILSIISKNKCSVLNIRVIEPSLEDVFISLTGKSLRG
jgi:ABC-2 type transport system ATP-binding protein